MGAAAPRSLFWSGRGAEGWGGHRRGNSLAGEGRLISQKGLPAAREGRAGRPQHRTPARLSREEPHCLQPQVVSTTVYRKCLVVTQKEPGARGRRALCTRSREPPRPGGGVARAGSAAAGSRWESPGAASRERTRGGGRGICQETSRGGKLSNGSDHTQWARVNTGSM